MFSCCCLWITAVGGAELGLVMDGSLKLLILSGVMLFGSYLAGSIPLFISLSEEKLQVSCVISGGRVAAAAAGRPALFMIKCQGLRNHTSSWLD